MFRALTPVERASRLRHSFYRSCSNRRRWFCLSSIICRDLAAKPTLADLLLRQKSTAGIARSEARPKEYTIMIQQTPQDYNYKFKKQLLDLLKRETLNTHTVKIRRHANVYTCGDQDGMIYFIESGQIKLLMLSPEGKECLLAIHSAGDILGEFCLCGLGERLETATAMKATVLKQIPSAQFLARLSRDSLLDFVRYLARHTVDQQQVIANIVTVDSEQRLGKTLLQLARTMGKKDLHSLRIETKISHVAAGF